MMLVLSHVDFCECDTRAILPASVGVTQDHPHYMHICHSMCHGGLWLQVLGTLRIWSPGLSCPSISAGVLATISLITTCFSLVSVPPITLSPSGPLPLVTSMLKSLKVGATIITMST